MHTSFVTARDIRFLRGMGAEQEREYKRKNLETIRAVAGADLNADDFHVRAAIVCNSERDHYYSRFSPEALNEVAELLPGRPLMVGHDYRGLPVGRFFSAKRDFAQQGRRPKRDGYFVEAQFYVTRDDQGDALVRRIDQGIYREVSLGWRCLGADCGICKSPIADMERCQHSPGEVYDEGLCDFQFSDVTTVLETSLVFSGGQKGTKTFDPEGRSERIDDIFTGMRWDRVADFKTHERGSRMAAGLRSSVSSLICSRDRFELLSEAAQWAREHDFSASRAESMAEAYRFRQPNAGEEGESRTIQIDAGVQAVISEGRRTRSSSFEEFLTAAKTA